MCRGITPCTAPLRVLILVVALLGTVVVFVAGPVFIAAVLEAGRVPEVGVRVPEVTIAVEVVVPKVRGVGVVIIGVMIIGVVRIIPCHRCSTG